MVNSTFSQGVFNKNDQIILKFGSGANFGGYGLNTEFRKNRFSIQLFLGHNKVKSDTNYIIPSSYNFGLNAFYYFLDSKSPIKPKIGFHFGWLNSYYNPKIGTAKYDPFVYGFALIPGLEFGDGFVRFGLNFILDPGFVIVDSRSHPYYSDSYYISSSVGIGIDVVGFRKALKNYRILKNYERNQKRKKTDNDNDADDNGTVVNNNSETVNSSSKLSIDDKCISFETNLPILKGICGENLIYQQISSDKFLIVEFERNIDDYVGTNTFNIADDKYVKVYLLSKASYNDFCSIIDFTKIFEKANEGKLTLLIENNQMGSETSKISIILKDISVSTQINNENKVQFFDEIVICNLIH